jgi:hypothetical protein
VEKNYPLFAVTVEERIVDVYIKNQEGESFPDYTASDLSQYMSGNKLLGNLDTPQVAFALLSDGTRLLPDGGSFDAYGENVPLTLVFVRYNQIPLVD